MREPARLYRQPRPPHTKPNTVFRTTQRKPTIDTRAVTDLGGKGVLKVDDIVGVVGLGKLATLKKDAALGKRKKVPLVAYRAVVQPHLCHDGV